jgi:hypothetical protein
MFLCPCQQAMTKWQSQATRLPSSHISTPQNIRQIVSTTHSSHTIPKTLILPHEYSNKIRLFGVAESPPRISYCISKILEGTVSKHEQCEWSNLQFIMWREIEASCTFCPLGIVTFGSAVKWLSSRERRSASEIAWSRTDRFPLWYFQVQPTRCNVTQFIYFCEMFYMFQAVPPPIIRS